MKTKPQHTKIRTEAKAVLRGMFVAVKNYIKKNILNKPWNFIPREREKEGQTET